MLIFLTNQYFFFKTGFLERIASTCLYPVLWSTNKVTTYLETIKTEKKMYKTLYEEYEKLQQNYQKLQEEMIITKASIHYDTHTKEIIDFQKRYNLADTLLAKVLIKHFSPQEHALFINRGARAGIKKGMVAIYKLQILGKVVETYDYYSKILLITDQKCKIAAFTNSTNATGILTGTNTLNKCHLVYVNHLSPVIQEDLVFSSGQGLVFPEGFCLGKIVSQKLKDKALYHDIEVQPLVDLTTLSFCLLTDQSKISLF